MTQQVVPSAGSDVETQAALSDAQQTQKETNESKKRDKLIRKITRAHEWRVQVWAQSELRIKSDQAALVALGGTEVDLFEPQFNDDEMLHHYADMPLSK